MNILKPWVVPLWKGCQLREMLGDTDETHWLRMSTELMYVSLDYFREGFVALAADYTTLSDLAMEHYHRMRDERMLREYRLRLEAAHDRYLEAKRKEDELAARKNKKLEAAA
jgi:hypothetical protein